MLLSDDPKILLKTIIFGNILHFGYGVLHVYSAGLANLLYLYVINVVFNVSLGFLFYKVYKNRDDFSPSTPLLLINLFSFCISHYVCYRADYALIPVVLNLVFIFGPFDSAWLYRVKHSFVIYAVGTASLLYSVHKAMPEHMNSAFINVCILILISWKLLNTYFQHSALLTYNESENLKTYKKTVATLNHHFRNISSVAIGVIERSKDQEKLERKDEILVKNLRRLLDLLDRMESINVVQDSKEDGKEGFVKLD